MCGIAGELRFDGVAADLAAVRRMSARLARRGPDAKGEWQRGPVAFAHRRLAIIDLTERSSQPMIDAISGLVLVFNGAIYNYPQLRAQLHQRGHVFFSDGDSEVILRAYLEWGEDCVNRLEGMFAFAIWDAQRQQLFLARDRLGIKPLYFAHNRHCLRFASNCQALLAAGDIDCDIDPQALHHQFSLHSVVPPPHTLLKGIRKLAQANCMTVDLSGQARTTAYWSLTAQRPAQTRSEAEWQEAIHEALRLAVKKRIEIADVKVGVLLSGGLDSSLLVALLAEQGVNDLMTFSVGFEDHEEEEGQEFIYSDAVAEHFGTRHHKYVIPNDEVLRRLPEAVDCMAEPMFSQDAVAFYLLAEQVSQSSKVVQSGQGADEVFAGYFWHQQMAAAAASLGPDSSSEQRLAAFAPFYFDRDHAEYLEMIAPPYQSADVTSPLMAAVLAADGADEFIDQVLRAEATLLITDDPVKRVDNMTLAWGLEARVPFLDHHLVELAMQLPPQLKLGSNGKHILKRIARGLVPDSVIDRNKAYFPLPALKYVAGDYLDFMRDTLNSRACIERGLYQRAYVDKLLAAPQSHLTRIKGSKLWHLALLELWLQRVVDA